MDTQEKAFAFAADTTKQLITLATGILALSITFKDKIVGTSADWLWLIPVAWVGYLFSILAGIWTLLALTGELEQIPQTGNKRSPSIRQSNVIIPTLAQIGLFVLGTLGVVGYAFGTL